MKALRAEEGWLTTQDGAAVSYRCTGAGSPLVLANGLGAGWEAYRRQAEHFGDRYRLLNWDYRGLLTPLSREASPASLSALAADGWAVADAEGVERAGIVGWSIGVQVALEMFRQAPQRVALLVLINGGGQAGWVGPRAGGLASALVPTATKFLGKAPLLAETLLRRWLRSPEAYTWARRARLVGDQLEAATFSELAAGLSRVDMEGWLRLLRLMGEYDASQMLHTVDVPTLVIVGDRDPFTSRAGAEQLVDQIRGAEYLVMPGATHFALLDHAPHVNLRMAKFFNERGY